MNHTLVADRVGVSDYFKEEAELLKRLSKFCSKIKLVRNWLGEGKFEKNVLINKLMVGSNLAKTSDIQGNARLIIERGDNQDDFIEDDFKQEAKFFFYNLLNVC